MAYFAQLGSDGKTVIQVHTVSNDVIGEPDLVFPETEARGQEFLASLGLPGTWLQCSYNGNFRGGFPGPGWTWDGTEFSVPIYEDPVLPNAATE